MGGGEDYVMSNVCSSPNIFRLIKSRRKMGGVCNTYGGEVYMGFDRGNLRERGHLEDPGVDWRIILKRVLMKWDEGAWAG
jgi:hypothetical protein